MGRGKRAYKLEWQVKLAVIVLNDFFPIDLGKNFKWNYLLQLQWDLGNGTWKWDRLTAHVVANLFSASDDLYSEGQEESYE